MSLPILVPYVYLLSFICTACQFVLVGDNTEHLVMNMIIHSISTQHTFTYALYISDYEFQSKRKRATPAYTLHSQANSTTLGPPCPLYGVTQPTEDESKRYIVHVHVHSIYFFVVTKMSLRQFRASTSKENEKGKSEKRINEERAVVKGREKREVATTLSSSSSLSSLSQSLNYYYDKEVESDLSLHKAARSGILINHRFINYYFITSEGNHRMLQQLLSKGYSVNGIDGEGVTPLMYW